MWVVQRPLHGRLFTRACVVVDVVGVRWGWRASAAARAFTGRVCCCPVTAAAHDGQASPGCLERRVPQVSLAGHNIGLSLQRERSRVHLNPTLVVGRLLLSRAVGQALTSAVCNLALS